jgi:hypothetical protein
MFSVLISILMRLSDRNLMLSFDEIQLQLVVEKSCQFVKKIKMRFRKNFDSYLLLSFTRTKFKGYFERQTTERDENN